MRIYHNPRCSKSRETLALIKGAGVNPEIIEYLKDPISIEDLRSLLEMLKIEPTALIRRNEKIWKERYSGEELTDDETIKVMIENPKLIERPIVVKNRQAIIGRPPKKVLSLLS